MSRVTLKSQSVIIAQLQAQVAELTTTKGLLMNEVDSFKNQLAYAQDETAQQARIADDYDAQLTEALSQLEVSAPVQSASSDDIDKLNDIIKCQAARIKLLSCKVAAQPKTAPVAKSVARMTIAPEACASSDALVITDEQKAFYAKFKALPQAQRLSIIEFARPAFGHIGLTNIIQVRTAWHQAQAA